MKIKSLLLGSAAALVAVSGARAADAIIAEPEPVEYVRVCDAYGAGFFYIPGTETCLRISGEVRVQIGGATGGTTYSVLARGRLNFDARSDTELGTLRGFIRIDGTRSHNTATVVADSVALDHGFIELGGFKVGYTDSTWATFAGYGSHSDSGLLYGFSKRHLASYTFSGNGFSAIFAVEDDNTANFVPDFVGGIAYSGGWGRAFAQVGYDENAAGWGGAAGVTINVPNAPGSSFIVKGYYASNAAITSYTVGSQWSILASYGHQFNSKLFASVGVQYRSAIGHVAGVNDWRTELNVVYTPVTNFAIRGELAYVKPAGAGSWAGFLRFSRFF
ncbi:MAG: porin [Notoacmeibacter sp.]|nr:porin [Notoacmeibacter sp.]